MKKIHSCQLQTLGYVKNYNSETKATDLIRHTLYHKYAASQNYYFTKEINEIISKQRTAAVILFQDYLHFDEEDEFMKRFYLSIEYDGKMKLLTEFYKFHKDLPRFSIHKFILQTLNYYYDRRRKLDYYKIQRQIEQENKLNPQQPPKGIVGDRPIESQSTPKSESSSEPSNIQNIDNILKDITQSQKKQEDLSNITQVQEEQQSEIAQIINMISTPQIKQQYQVFKKQKANFKKQLKLDELTLSTSARAQQNPQEAKMPLSARYPSYSVSKIQNKHSSLSKERSTDVHINKDNLVQLFNKYSTTKKLKIQQIPRNPLVENKKPIPEIKQLELKIIKSLQEIEKNKVTQKIVSLDSKALHSILSKFNHPMSTRHIQQVDSFKSTSNQSIQVNKNKFPNQKPFTPRNKLLNSKSNENASLHLKKSTERQAQVKALDLKKLMVYKSSEKSAKTERCKKNVPVLNLNAVMNNNQSSFTSRNQSGNPSFIQLLTPKPQTARYRINNLIHWQVKAIQAAQRDYKLTLNNNK